MDISRGMVLRVFSVLLLLGLSPSRASAAGESALRIIPTPYGLVIYYPSDGKLAITGRVTAPSGTGIAGVSVVGKACTACATRTTVTDAGGNYAFDPYSGGSQISPQPGYTPEINVRASKTGYVPQDVFLRPVSGTVWVGGKPRNYASVPAIILGHHDSDSDGLSDEAEAVFDTAPDIADTDDDGVGDAAESYGYNWVDYRWFGGNPVHKDFYIEVDYEFYSDGIGEHSAAISQAVINKLTSLYSNLPIPNPDGSDGVIIHVFHDTKLPEGVNCNGNGPVGEAWPTNPNFDPFHEGSFRYMATCFDPAFGAKAQNDRMGQRGPEGNLVTFDDQTEYVQFRRYADIAHEFGHLMGLGHGGSDTVNHKPNYPSMMNYSYEFSFRGSPHTLQDTLIQFSSGGLVGYDLDENSVLERQPFAGSGVDLSSFLHFAVYANGAEGDVDWNGDGVISAGPYVRNISGDLVKGTTVPILGVLRDNDDAATIADKLGDRITGVDEDDQM